MNVIDIGDNGFTLLPAPCVKNFGKFNEAFMVSKYHTSSETNRGIEHVVLTTINGFTASVNKLIKKEVRGTSTDNMIVTVPFAKDTISYIEDEEGLMKVFCSLLHQLSYSNVKGKKGRRAVGAFINDGRDTITFIISTFVVYNENYATLGVDDDYDDIQNTITRFVDYWS